MQRHAGAKAGKARRVVPDWVNRLSGGLAFHVQLAQE
jgi:hypothetical protein